MLRLFCLSSCVPLAKTNTQKSLQQGLLNESQTSESERGTQQTDSAPSEQVDIDRFIYVEFYIQLLKLLKEYSKHFSHMIETTRRLRIRKV